jgi:hypothetical protein
LAQSAVLTDSHFVKQLWAIVLSLALILTQNVSALSLAVTQHCAVKKHCCCGAGKNCCAAKNPSDSHPTPAVPATAGVFSQFLALPVSALAFTAANSPAARISPTVPPVHEAGAVSIYQRNCAYLI